MNYKQYLPAIRNAVNEYGQLVEVKRDIYENVVGVKTLVEKGRIVASMRVIIDNSRSSSSNNYNVIGSITRPSSAGTLYYAYDENINIQRGDYIIIDNKKYIIDTPADIMHVHLVYQCNLEGVIPNE